MASAVVGCRSLTRPSLRDGALPLPGRGEGRSSAFALGVRLLLHLEELLEFALAVRDGEERGALQRDAVGLERHLLAVDAGEFGVRQQRQAQRLAVPVVAALGPRPLDAFG